ncbi:carboxypeptidase regulatory-like domain-containing protein [Myxococcus sp. CA056]|uniref:carboxypeptidase regulatory-like domain-containing protein n=1 Tax=Myxococcus sp. CA056 TaxID=2741740 RepID=UPI00157B8809|nr:carboxypeptidase regulatory-like domain-containing protein [Myxococcus sp. CA056]
MTSAIGVLALAGILGGLLLPKPEAPTATQRAFAPRTGTGIVLPPPAPRPEGTLSIQGVVLGDEGPLAGVRVTATRPEAGQTLSELTCEQVLPHRRGDHRRFPLCFLRDPGLTLELLLSRQGEAPVYAESFTTEDGRFSLDNLPEGDFTLWAIGPRGAHLQPGIPAGTQGLLLRLEEGVFLEGQVIDEDLAPLPQVQVTVVNKGSTRFFDGETDAGGRYRIGPLLVGDDHVLAFAKDGWLPSLRADGMEQPVKLVRPRRIVGRVMLQGTPVPNATVHLWDLTLKGESLAPRGPGTTDTTDEQGRFAFEALPSHLLHLEASQGESQARTLVDMATHVPASEVILELSRATFLEGTVRDESGASIEGATITLLELVEPKWRTEFSTDAMGHYRLGPLPPIPHNIAATTPRHFPASSSLKKLGPGTKRLDFVLRFPRWVDGVLVDETGHPVPDVLIDVDTAAMSDTYDSHLLAPYETRSDEQGRFHLNLPEPGTFLLKIKDDPRFSMEELQVRAPDAKVRWVLKRGATVSGTVFNELDTPMAGLLVRLSTVPPEGTTSEPWMDYTLGETRTDARGHYAFGGMRQGRFVLEAAHESGAVQRFATQHVELRDQQAAHVDLRLAAGWTLSGRVEDGGGQPLSGAGVFIHGTPDSAPAWREGHHRSTEPFTQTQVDGRFTLRNLPSQEVELRVMKESFHLAPHLSTGGKPGLDSVHAREGGPPVRLVMSRQGRIHGRLVGPDGQPLTRFQLLHHTVEHPRGEFSLDVEGAGSWTVVLQAKDLAPVVREVEVHHDTEVVNLGEVRMSPGRRVAGHVLDAETSAPLEGAMFSINPETLRGEPLEPHWTEQHTLKDGSFSIPHVDERSTSLDVWAHGYPTKRLMLAPGPQENLTVLLEKGARVEISVMDSRGQPAEASVFMDREGGRLSRTRVDVSPNGPRVVRDLPPGHYQARASPPEGSFETYAPQHVQIPSSGDVSVTLKARSAGATLELRVNGPSRRVTALLAGEVPLLVFTHDIVELRERSLPHEGSKKGTMTFRNLPPGKATLFLVTDDWRGVYREVIDLPETGMVVREVTPVWTPIKP